MTIEFKRLTEIKKSLVIDLMNNPLVGRHLPLLKLPFNDSDYESFIESKEQIWESYKFGPYAFMYKNNFIGWGGLQPDINDIEIALILHPNYWGIGKTILIKLVHEAFHIRNLPSITILFPKSRSRVKGLLNYGFVKVGEVFIKDTTFVKYRLENYLFIR